VSPSRTLSAPSKFPLFPVLLALVLAAGWTRHADAANIIYVHGRSLSTWPPGGLLVAISRLASRAAPRRDTGDALGGVDLDNKVRAINVETREPGTRRQPVQLLVNN
jgi:hypothetical protein